MAKITLYHGTAHEFAQFDNRFTIRGTEPNSALGVHLTESPALAAEYAEMASRDIHGIRPRVLVVEATVSKVALVSSRVEFLGRPDAVFGHNHMRLHSEFVDARLELQSKGFDAIAGEALGDDLIGAWVVFDASALRIVGELPVHVAQEMEDAELPMGIDFEGVSLFGTTLEAGPCR